MNLARPGLLWLLWLLPPLLLLGWSAARRRSEALGRFVDPKLAARLAPPESVGRRALRVVLLYGALALMLTAAAGPRWGFRWEEVKRRGVDLVVALDLSRSMLAEDLKPNRLTAAKREIRDLLDLMQGDRVGLVVFAGMAITQVPLTLDYGAFEVFLDQLDPNWVPFGGTDLGRAVRQSIATFAPGDRAGRAVILITDGEDHAGELRKAAQEAKKEGVHVFVVGLGEPEGAPIPDGNGGFVEHEGTVVLTKLDEAALKELALTTGGSYVRGVAGTFDLEQIYLQDIRATLQARQLGSSRQKRWEERFVWFLLPALLALLAEALLGAPRRTNLRALTALLALAAAPAAAPSEAQAGWFGADDPARLGFDAFSDGRHEEALQHWLDAQTTQPSDRRLDYNIGQAQYALGAFPEAEQAFLAAAATDQTELAADALYGAGNAAFEQGKYLEAIAHYERCLELRPEDADAQANRDLAQRRYEELLEQAQDQQEQDQQQDQQQPPEQSDPGQQNEDAQADEQQQQQQQQQQQEQQQGSAAQEQQQGEPQPEDGGDASAEEQPTPEDAGEQGQQSQADPKDEQQAQQGGAAAAADIDRESTPEDDGEPKDGALAEQTEESESGQDAQAQPVEGALSRQEAEAMLQALQADQEARRRERTEREAARGRRAARKDW